MAQLFKLPELSDIQHAAQCIKPVVHLTPVLSSQRINTACGGDVWFKCENLQKTGAFKFRGAFYAMSQLTSAVRKKGVMTYSSGNHAQALALAAQLHQTSITVIMPTNAPPIKKAAAEGYGAHIVTYDPNTQEREEVAADIQQKHGFYLIPPFDHPDIIAGQGTATLELLAQQPQVEQLLVPCGGGGLLSGTSIVAKSINPKLRVIGVEPNGANNGQRAFQSGKIETVSNPQTIADGLKPKSLGKHTFSAIHQYVDEIVCVSDEEIIVALSWLWNTLKLVVEPSGAVGLAALLFKKPKAPQAVSGVILSGGNADIQAIASYLG